MVPSAFHDFFLAMSSAGGALIGLLFVAVSINAEHVVGPRAAPERQGVAATTLTALVTGFVISSFALLPSFNIGYVTIGAAALGFGQSLLLGLRLLRQRLPAVPDRQRWVRRLRLLMFSLVGLALYGYEFVLGRRIASAHFARDTLLSLAVVVLSVYLVGLFRAWTLLGARRHGPGAWLNPLEDVVETPPSEAERPKAVNE